MTGIGKRKNSKKKGARRLGKKNLRGRRLGLHSPVPLTRISEVGLVQENSRARGKTHHRKEGAENSTIETGGNKPIT